MPFAAPHAKKSLGQHFLHDEHAIRRIVEMLRVEPGDHVLEIGPGPGALTRLLRDAPFSRLLLLEKDDRFAAAHAAQAHPRADVSAHTGGFFQPDATPPDATPPDAARPRIDVVHGDALAFDWARLDGPWKIVGNLPYNIASPLLWDIVSRAPAWQRLVCMLQKEVADRILAVPGTKAYGALTVWLRSYSRPHKGFTLGPGAFRPPPAVDSAVIVLEPVPAALRPARPDALARLIKLCFGQRRKQLRGILRNALPGADTEGALAACGIDPQRRPETLTEQEFQALAGALADPEEGV